MDCVFRDLLDVCECGIDIISVRDRFLLCDKKIDLHCKSI